MIAAKQFLIDFTKDLIKHPMERQQIIAGYAQHLEAREKLISEHPEVLRPNELRQEDQILVTVEVEE